MLEGSTSSLAFDLKHRMLGSQSPTHFPENSDSTFPYRPPVVHCPRIPWPQGKFLGQSPSLLGMAQSWGLEIRCTALFPLLCRAPAEG